MLQQGDLGLLKGNHFRSKSSVKTSQRWNWVPTEPFLSTNRLLKHFKLA